MNAADGAGGSSPGSASTEGSFAEFQRRFVRAGALLETDRAFQRLDAHTQAALRVALAQVLGGERTSDGHDPIREAALEYLPRTQVAGWVERLHRVARNAAGG